MMIEMDSKKWNEKIKNNFNDAAYRYLEHSNIQKFFAKKIVFLNGKILVKKLILNIVVLISFALKNY